MINYTDRITIDPWKMKVMLDGNPIELHLLSTLHRVYEIMCTAEFMMNNYDFLDEKIAWELAEKVRRNMDKYNSSEELTISLVIDEYMEDRNK